MIQFPLKIEVFCHSSRLWRAHTVASKYEVHMDALTKEQALGALFCVMKDVPGFNLWTFDISLQEEDDTMVELTSG